MEPQAFTPIEFPVRRAQLIPQRPDVLLSREQPRPFRRGNCASLLARLDAPLLQALPCGDRIRPLETLTWPALDTWCLGMRDGRQEPSEAPESNDECSCDCGSKGHENDSCSL